ACVDTNTSAANCGGCGNACDPGQSCVGGACVVSTSQWQMLGGDAVHSGFNAQETGKPPLSPAWSVQLAGGALNPVVVEDGRVFATADSFFAQQTMLWATGAADGSALWSYNFGNVFGTGQPAVVGG